MQGTPGVFGSAILEVAVGVLFLYFLLSTVCSSINEIIATLLKWRAKNLEYALGNLVTDPALLREVLNHPLLRSMGQNPSDVRGQARQAPKLEGKPSYIPARVFSLALLHSLSNPVQPVADSAGSPPAPAGPADHSINVRRVRQNAIALANTAATTADSQAKQITGRALLALMEESRDPQGLAHGIDTLKQQLQDGLTLSPPPAGSTQLRLDLAGASTLDQVREAVLALPDSAPRVWALGVVERADEQLDATTYKLDRLRTSIESWFDQAMDRASGVYKRTVLLVLAIIAVFVTVASGADSIRFVSRLYVDSVLRAQLAQQATQAGQSSSAQPAPSSPDISKTVQQLEPFATLFGYADFPGTAAVATVAQWLVLKVAGEVATIFAILLGAPFWFDTLMKLANLRGSGPPPPSSTDAARTKTSKGAT